MPAEYTPVSFLPEEMREGGGLWERKRVRFTNCKFVSSYTYTKKDGSQAGKPSCVLMVDMVDLDDPNMVSNQVWSVGDGMAASVDGKNTAPEGTRLVGTHSVTKTSNFGLLTLSINDAFPDDKRAEYAERMLKPGDVRGWEGLECEVIRKDVEGRSDMSEPGDTTKKKTPQVIIVDLIEKLPWQAAAASPGGVKVPGAVGAPKAAGKPAGAKAAAAPPPAAKPAGATPPPPAAKKPPAAAAPALTDEQVQASAVSQVAAVLTAKGGLTRDEIGMDVYTRMPASMERDRVIGLISSGETDEWLNGNSEVGGWYLATDDKFYMNQ